MTVTLRDFLIVTHAVPAERVRPHVPASLPLDMLPGSDGTRLAFLQTACLYNDNLHWSPLPGPGLSYHQSTYRVLTRRRNRRGAYFLRTYVGTPAAHLSQRAIAREIDYAPFTVHITGDPSAPGSGTYTMRAVGERGQTAMEARALSDKPAPPAPFADYDDMAFFLTQREECFADASTGGIVLLPVEHAPMHPIPMELLAARFSLWTDLGLLTIDELLQPIAILLQPEIVFTGFPPRPARL